MSNKLRVNYVVSVFFSVFVLLSTPSNAAIAPQRASIVHLANYAVEGAWVILSGKAVVPMVLSLYPTKKMKSDTTHDGTPIEVAPQQSLEVAHKKLGTFAHAQDFDWAEYLRLQEAFESRGYMSIEDHLRWLALSAQHKRFKDIEGFEPPGETQTACATGKIDCSVTVPGVRQLGIDDAKGAAKCDTDDGTDEYNKLALAGSDLALDGLCFDPSRLLGAALRRPDVIPQAARPWQAPVPAVRVGAAPNVVQSVPPRLCVATLGPGDSLFGGTSFFATKSHLDEAHGFMVNGVQYKRIATKYDKKFTEVSYGFTLSRDPMTHMPDGTEAWKHRLASLGRSDEIVEIPDPPEDATIAVIALMEIARFVLMDSCLPVAGRFALAGLKVRFDGEKFSIIGRRIKYDYSGGKACVSPAQVNVMFYLADDPLYTPCNRPTPAH